MITIIFIILLAFLLYSLDQIYHEEFKKKNPNMRYFEQMEKWRKK